MIRATRHRVGILRWTGAILVAGLCGACGDDGSQAVKWAGLRPGECLLDHLDRARVDRLPGTNLPATFQSFLRQSHPFRTGEYAGEDWLPWGSEDADVLLREYEGRVWAWRLVPVLFRIPDTAVEILKDGVPLPVVDRSKPPFPEELIFWDEEHGEVRAVGRHLPEGISLRYQADPMRVFSVAEPRLMQVLADPERTLPSASALTGRLVQQDVSRRCLNAPATSRITFEMGTLETAALRVAMAVRDRGFEVVEGALRRVPRAGDGVTFAVEVTADGRTQRVFERHLDREQVGGEWQTAEVDLGPFQGQEIQLHLVTEPGPAGDADFDYGVWADLRLKGAEAAVPTRPHVILVDVDTLRADRLSCQGNPLPTTPLLDRWARERAVRYAQARATAGWTLPSTASILTGLSVHQHGVDAFPKRLERAHRALPLLLRESGYETVALTEGIYVKPEFGFDLGFDLYDCTRDNNPDWAEALEWIQSRQSEQPFFLLLHTYLVHAPWPFAQRLGDCRPDLEGDLVGQKIGYANAINPFRRGQLELNADEETYISRMYDERVRLMDQRIGPFLVRLEKALQGQPYLLVFLSDHGDEFFEHGGLDHGHTLYQELVHVPLIIRYPEGAGAPPPGSVVERPVSTLDLLPTILDVVGLPLPDDRHLPGRSLLVPEPEEQPLVAHQGPRVRSIEFQGWKLIQQFDADAEGASRMYRLYHLAEDPGEQVDLVAEQPTILKRLLRLLERYESEHAPVQAAAEAAVDPELIRLLRAQGYLVGDEGS